MEDDIWAGKYQQSASEQRDGRRNENEQNDSSGSEGTQNAGCGAPTTAIEPSIKCEDTEDATAHKRITISEQGKQTIQNILDQVKTLSQVEKFLLFLKLPSEVTNPVDPFRQPLNPLGSRSEIYKTILWIKTHLEEDPDISLPKQEVYNEYFHYCESNCTKPLSQADFGKVMKQVYPKVRARRLGTRGNSRYCYSGLRRCIKLKPPVLPDLADKPLSTETPFTEANLASAAWVIVKDWAEQQLGQEFCSIQALAYHVLSNFSFGIGTKAANIISAAAESNSKDEESNGKGGGKHREMQLQLQRKLQQKSEGKERKRKMQSPKSEHQNHQRSSGCKKSRSQSTPASRTSSSAAVTVTSSVSASASPILGAPAGIQGAALLGALPVIPLTSNCDGTTPGGSGSSGGECSTAGSSTASSPTTTAQGKTTTLTVCDKTMEFATGNNTQLPMLPDFNGFHGPVIVTSAAASTVPPNALLGQDASTGTPKVPIPRLKQQTPGGGGAGSGPNGTGGTAALAVAAAASAAVARLHQAKYKLLQPRPHQTQQQILQQQQPCDISQSYNPQPEQKAEGHRSQLNVINDLVGRIKENRSVEEEQRTLIGKAGVMTECDRLDEEDEVADFPLTRERINSVSNVEKDAMDEYLGTNNDQHDEELSKYFSNNNVNETSVAVAGAAQPDTTYKLSHLRQLLEQNGIADRKPVLDDHKVVLNDFSASAATVTEETSSVVKTEMAAYIPTLSANQITLTSMLGGGKRRVSFETPVIDDAILTSPNTKRKNFSFTPISPGPHSPNGMQSSKCSSTTVSPFVSPRDTPISKQKGAPHQNVLKTEIRKPSKVKKELSLDLPGDFNTAGNYLPMSAPVSPMLQKLLKSNSKVAYNPGYASCQNVSQVNPLFNSDINTNRSQSVPLQQMFLPSDESGSGTAPAASIVVAETSAPIPVADGDNAKRILNTLDERACDNVDLFNIDITANNGCLNEFGIQLINNNMDMLPQNDVGFVAVAAARTGRSQSIDVVTPFELKCGGTPNPAGNPSRSVPSTPLPFIISGGSKPASQNNQQKSGLLFATTRSYPSTPLNNADTDAFTYNLNADCLLNGQPIRSDSVPDGLDTQDGSRDTGVPPAIYDEMEKEFNIDAPEFQMVAQGDIESVLIEQNFSGNIN